jgi:hypothetical protein
VTDIVETEIKSHLFKRCYHALLKADGGTTPSADHMVVVVRRFLGKVELLAFDNHALEESRLIKGVKDPVNGRPVADFTTYQGMNLFR